MTKRDLDTTLYGRGLAGEALGVDLEQHLDGVPAQAATVVAGTPPLSQVDLG